MALRSLIRAGNIMKQNLISLSTRRARHLGTATVPKLKAYAPTVEQVNYHHQLSQNKPKGAAAKGDYVPVYVSVGMITLSLGFGLHTAKQQLLHAPDVHVKKSKRETLPEVEEPEEVADEADKFLKHSFFRKVAHVQEFKTPLNHDAIRGDNVDVARKPRVETLKTVGIDPKANATSLLLRS